MDSILSDIDSGIARILAKALEGKEISVPEAVSLFSVSHRDLMVMVVVADEIRASTVGNAVTYVHNRNINFTNICEGSCKFCAFRRSPHAPNGGYTLDLREIVAKAVEASEKGATEVCIQGGLNPGLDPHLYIQMCEAIKGKLPDMHIHAFSPMEILFASRRLTCSIERVLRDLKSAGLGSMPGTAAEILDDSIRSVICPAKLTTDEWMGVISTAHRLGIPTSSTMLYGHIENPEHRARHIDQIRRMQKKDGRFTEFIPLRFLYRNTALYRQRRCGPSISGMEDIKVHAVSRLMLNGCIDNIQVSWVKLGPQLAQVCLYAGANDLGGTLMEEHISRSAGSSSPSSLTVSELQNLINACDRTPRQRTTTYGIVGVN